MAEKLIGKSWDGPYKMSYDEMSSAKEFLNSKIWFIKPSKDFGLDSILDTVKSMVRRYGIDYFVIDAWNKLEHKYDQNETKYVGESMDKIVSFCETNNVHCFLVAHPKKIQKDKVTQLYDVPTLYDIAGSANFFNKTDLGICVYRDFEKKETTVYYQKVKFRHWGVGEFVALKYDITCGRYYEEGNIDATNWIKRKPEQTIPIPAPVKPSVELKSWTEPNEPLEIF
jgi:twinkle protein